MSNSLPVELIETAARIRGNPPVPRDFITEALERVEEGKEEVERYPGGEPSALGVYMIALRLYEECFGTSQE